MLGMSVESDMLPSCRVGEDTVSWDVWHFVITVLVRSLVQDERRGADVGEIRHGGKMWEQHLPLVGGVRLILVIVEAYQLFVVPALQSTNM